MPQPEQPGKKSRQKRARKAKSIVSGSPNRKAVDPNLLLHDLFDDLEIGLANVMPSGVIVYCNRKFEITLGTLPHRDSTGMNLRELIAPHSWEPLEAALRAASKQSVIGEIKLNDAAGKSQTIRLFFTPATIMGQPVIRIVADEVTELVESNLQLRETEASLRALSGRILQVQDEERRKMARDLHDTTGQELAVLVMSLRQLAGSIDREGVDIHKVLLEAADLAQKVNDDIRTLSYVLHPPLLDQLGLGSALSWYVEGFSKRSNIQVKLVVSDELRRFSVEKETALFRVVQEALTNVLRHANTDKAKIVVCASADEVEVTVEDEGKGFSKADVQRLAAPGSDRTVGVGIAGLRERLHQLGGKLEISSRQGGARLRAVVPLNENEAAFATPSVHPAGEEARTHRSPISRNNCKRILIADDHEVVRRGIRGLLENYDDLEICGEAQDGLETVQKTQELHPDLVILDLNMPGSGGLSAASQLQSNGSGVKILIFSMHALPDGMRRPVPAGCDTLPVVRRAQGTKKGRPAMQKLSTRRVMTNRILKGQQLTIGLDLGDRWSFYCVLDERGEVVREEKLPTTPDAMKRTFEKLRRSRIVLETGTHSPWISRLLRGLGHEVIVAHAQKVHLITKSSRKDDRHDARTLARLGRIDPELLGPVRHRSAKAQIHLTVIRARAELVSARTALINAARGLAKSYGERLPKRGTQQVGRELAAALSTVLREVLEPLLREVESLNERIREYDQRIEQIAKEVYPEVALLKQVKGVGTQIALTYRLTIDDPHRFSKSREVGCFLGLRPGRRNSGQSEPEKKISKEGDRYLRTMMVQGAHYILGPFGEDSDLRRWGLKLAERGGKNAKKRAIVAVARKLAILLHRLWVTAEVYEPLRNSRRAMGAAA